LMIIRMCDDDVIFVLYDVSVDTKNGGKKVDFFI